jgi:uncharacterized protein
MCRKRRFSLALASAYSGLLGYLSGCDEAATQSAPICIQNIEKIIMKYLRAFLCVVFLLLAVESHAVSFDCAKAATLVEKTICSEKRLSELDDLLMQSYRQAVANVANKDAIKAEQRAWLKNRNLCLDPECLRKSYEERIKQLDKPLAQNNDTKNIVLGRCHMNSCWWWKIEKAESIKSESKGELIKVQFRMSSVGYTDAEVNKNGYPDSPPEKSRWGKVSEAFIFCSKKLPAYIEYDKEKKNFTVSVPFGVDGSTYGATEGVGNLYYYVCKTGSEPKFEMSPELESLEMTIENPSDIFNIQLK